MTPRRSRTCTGALLDAGGPVPADTVRVWYFGDGRKTENSAQVIDACYETPGEYYVQVVDYHHQWIGRHPFTTIAASRRWAVEVPG